MAAPSIKLEAVDEKLSLSDSLMERPTIDRKSRTAEGLIYKITIGIPGYTRDRVPWAC